MTPNLDDLLTLEQCAEWLGMTPVILSAKAKGTSATVPGIWINSRVVRFHPRTVLATFARRAGWPEGMISAVYGQHFTQRHD